MLIPAYFEYQSPEQASRALALVAELRQANSAFALVLGWQRNHNPEVVEIDFFKAGNQYYHPLDFPARGDIQEICAVTGAVRATRENEVIWPRE